MKPDLSLDELLALVDKGEATKIKLEDIDYPQPDEDGEDKLHFYGTKWKIIYKAWEYEYIQPLT